MTSGTEPSAVTVPVRKGHRLPIVLMQSIAARLGLAVFNGVTGIITARALDPGGRGELAAIILWPVLMAALTTFGLPGALIYHVKRSPRRASALIAGAYLLATMTGLIATAIGWFLIPWWLGSRPTDIVWAAQLCVLSTTVSSLTLVSRAAWEAHGDFSLSATSQLIAPVVIIVVLLIRIGTGELTPLFAASTYVLAGVPSLLWNLISTMRIYRPRPTQTLRMWRRLLHYGARSYGVDLFGVLSVYLDQALVVGLLAPAAMGVYVVALSLARVLNVIQGSVATMLFPKAIGLRQADLLATVSRSARLSMLVALAIGLVLALLGGPLVHWVYGSDYDYAGRILPLVVAETIVTGMAYVLLQGFMAAGRPGVATLIQAAGVVMSLPLFFVLVPRFGVFGAASALLVSTLIRLALTLAAFPAFLRVPTPRVWIGARDVIDLAGYRRMFTGAVASLRAEAK